LVSLWTATVWLVKKEKPFLFALIPSMFMTMVVTTYIIIAPEGFVRFFKNVPVHTIEYYKKGKKARLISIVLSPLYKFIRMYIIRLGFLDGLEGFLLATTSSLYTMVKYYKLREIYKNGSYIEGEGNNGN